MIYWVDTRCFLKALDERAAAEAVLKGTALVPRDQCWVCLDCGAIGAGGHHGAGGRAGCAMPTVDSCVADNIKRGIANIGNVIDDACRALSRPT